MVILPSSRTPPLAPSTSRGKSKDWGHVFVSPLSLMISTLPLPLPRYPVTSTVTFSVNEQVRIRSGKVQSNYIIFCREAKWHNVFTLESEIQILKNDKTDKK